MVCGHIVLCYHPTGKTVARYGFSFAAHEHLPGAGPDIFPVPEEFCFVCRGGRSDPGTFDSPATRICASWLSTPKPSGQQAPHSVLWTVVALLPMPSASADSRSSFRVRRDPL